MSYEKERHVPISPNMRPVVYFAVFVILVFGTMIGLIFSGVLAPTVDDTPLPPRLLPKDKAASGKGPETPASNASLEVRLALEEGKKAEEAKDWKAAFEAYRKAMERDDFNARAREGFLRVMKSFPRRVPRGLGNGFVLPIGSKDMHGNSVVFRGSVPADPVSGLAYEIWLKDLRMELVFVPAGSFQMGSPSTEAGRKNEEEPAHRVRVYRPFYMGKYEVTQEQWLLIREKSSSHFPGKNRPVENVLWSSCRDFLKNLNSRFLSASRNARFRLPSEAEWEYACRAGTDTRYFFGGFTDELLDYAWIRNNSGKKHHRPVGGKKANPWGFHDMFGNVWEWCEDVWHKNYLGAPNDGSVWKGPAGPHVMRGGSWDYEAPQCRSASRAQGKPNYCNNNTGFRVVLEFHEPREKK